MKKELNELKVLGVTKILGKDFTMYGDKENPLFLAKEVADCIKHTNLTVMLRSVDNDELVKIRPKHCLGLLTNNNEYNFLTENGLYEVCMLSRKEEAKQMKKEVKLYLKQIRINGGVVQPNREEEFVDNYLSSLSDDTKKLVIKELQDKNNELQEFYDDLLNTDGLMDMNTVAKELNIGEYTLFAYLRGKKILFYNPDENNIPYQRFMKENKFKVKKTPCRDGKYRDVTYATNKGLEYIRKQLRKDNYYKEVQANA